MKAGRNETRNVIVGLLAGGPMTRGELEAATGKRLQGTMSDLLRKRVVHVHGWLRGIGNMRAMRIIYGLGDQPDAPRPPPGTEKHRRYYEKHKAKIAERRKGNYHKYSAKAAEAQRRRRAKQKLMSNPFLQLAPEIFVDLKSKVVATKNAAFRDAFHVVPALYRSSSRASARRKSAR